MNPKVDWFFDKKTPWQQEYAALRAIPLACGLTEELRWGCPCYTLDKKNVVLIHGFKDYCALLFFKGALLKDPKGIMVQQTKNVQASRQIRFTGVQEVVKLKRALKAYVEAAIAVEKAGLTVSKKATADFTVPDEFAVQLKAQPALKRAFQSLTPGRQRAYLLHFASAKQSTTREARVGKHIPRILMGKGLDD